MTNGLIAFLVIWAVVLFWCAAHCDEKTERALQLVLLVTSLILIPAFGLTLWLVLGGPPR